MGRGKKGAPRALFFFLPVSPRLWHKRASAEERLFQATTVFQSGTIAAIAEVEPFLSR